MNNLLKIYKRMYSFCAYNLFLYANFLLLFVFLLGIKPDLIIPISIKLLPAYFLIGIGGYFLNDLFDQKEDRLVKKFNVTTIINKYLIFFIINVVWAIGFFLVYSISKIASYVLVVQYLALLMYSIPFFRFKERGIYGLFTDAFYAHVIPEIILLVIIQQYAKIPFLLCVQFLLFTFLLGIRDILIHQLNSLKEDSKSNTNTYAVKYTIRAKKYVGYIENIAAIALVNFFFYIQFFYFSIFFLSLFFVLVISYIIVIIKDKNLTNDVLIRNYVIVSSFFFSCLLIINENYYSLLLLIHPYFIKPLINYTLYYVFLIFGRNLKEKPLY